jgi:hypothetical protein
MASFMILQKKGGWRSEANVFFVFVSEPLLVVTRHQRSFCTRVLARSVLLTTATAESTKTAVLSVRLRIRPPRACQLRLKWRLKLLLWVALSNRCGLARVARQPPKENLFLLCANPLQSLLTTHHGGKQVAVWQTNRLVPDTPVRAWGC